MATLLTLRGFRITPMPAQILLPPRRRKIGSRAIRARIVADDELEVPEALREHGLDRVLKKAGLEAAVGCHVDGQHAALIQKSLGVTRHEEGLALLRVMEEQRPVHEMKIWAEDLNLT